MKLRFFRQARSGAAVALALLAGCAIEITNTQPARDLAAAKQPAGSVYTGWRVFQDKCARCHGESALGTAQGPNLVEVTRSMSQRGFIEFVLLRYEWNLPRTEPQSEARRAQVDEVLARKAPALAMPDFGGDARVTAHIADLYSYVSARAGGTQGPGRPAP
jgi:mono/diheme cytochrome c family protein